MFPSVNFQVGIRHDLRRSLSHSWQQPLPALWGYQAVGLSLPALGAAPRWWCGCWSAAAALPGKPQVSKARGEQLHFLRVPFNPGAICRILPQVIASVPHAGAVRGVIWVILTFPSGYWDIWFSAIISCWEMSGVEETPGTRLAVFGRAARWAREPCWHGWGSTASSSTSSLGTQSLARVLGSGCASWHGARALTCVLMVAHDRSWQTQVLVKNSPSVLPQGGLVSFRILECELRRLWAAVECLPGQIKPLEAACWRQNFFALNQVW